MMNVDTVINWVKYDQLQSESCQQFKWNSQESVYDRRVISGFLTGLKLKT